MRRISVQQFMSEFSFVSICKDVRENGNSYPFLTFMDANNVATNIYFSVGAAANVSKGMPVTKELVGNHEVTIYVLPDTGEERIKLSRKGGEGLRVSFDDLFG